MQYNLEIKTSQNNSLGYVVTGKYNRNLFHVKFGGLHFGQTHELYYRLPNLDIGIIENLYSENCTVLHLVHLWNYQCAQISSNLLVYFEDYNSA